MSKRIMSFLLVAILAMTSGAAGIASAGTTLKETVIKLTDSTVTVNGAAASKTSDAAVYTGASIVYYEDGRDSSYGEGMDSDSHSVEEAGKHTVVTITQPGTYRISGKLSAGQLAIDLGEAAASDPAAVVRLILDGVTITNTVAPAVIFYNVYEPYSKKEDTKGVVDLRHAGAQVVLADDSVNVINGSYVARIFKEGTTKKLHKYDGAFYSKMSMNISGEAKGTGELHITAANEGLGSELHLALNGGKVFIESQDDGINTNEDGISVTTINTGYLYVNAGLGAEGDGIDSNGYLTINGGTIVTMSNEYSRDGGIDADEAITINGGTVIALGKRNDATSSASKQPFIELAFAAPQAAGSKILLMDDAGNELLRHTAEKAFKNLTFSSAELKLNTKYQLYIDGKQQRYTAIIHDTLGSGFGIKRPSSVSGSPQEAAAFVLTNEAYSFTGVSETADASDKATVSFIINDGAGIQSAASAVLEKVSASASIPETDIQLTVVDIPSEDYFEAYLLSDIKNDFSKLMPETEGQYRLTISVAPSNKMYTGVSEWVFTISELPFEDVYFIDASYKAIKALYEEKIMIGTSANQFSPHTPVTRASVITTLGRLLKVEQTESSVFHDIAINSWYSGYVGWAVDNGLIVGDGKGSFMPDAHMTAEQMRLIIERYVQLSGLTISADDLFPSSLTDTDVMTRAELALVLSNLY